MMKEIKGDRNRWRNPCAWIETVLLNIENNWEPPKSTDAV